MTPGQLFRQTVGDVARVFVNAMKETPREMFSPWVAFWKASRDIGRPKDLRPKEPAQQRNDQHGHPNPQ